MLSMVVNTQCMVSTDCMMSTLLVCSIVWCQQQLQSRIALGYPLTGSVWFCQGYGGPDCPSDAKASANDSVAMTPRGVQATLVTARS